MVNLYTKEGVELLRLLPYTSMNVHSQQLKFKQSTVEIQAVNGQSPEISMVNNQASKRAGHSCVCVVCVCGVCVFVCLCVCGVVENCYWPQSIQLSVVATLRHSILIIIMVTNNNHFLPAAGPKITHVYMCIHTYHLHNNYVT